jgi:hypothetical protein
MQLLVEPVARLRRVFTLAGDCRELPGLSFICCAHRRNRPTAGRCVRELREQTTFCSICFNITESDPCLITTDEKRDRSVICVVESRWTIAGNARDFRVCITFMVQLPRSKVSARTSCDCGIGTPAGRYVGGAGGHHCQQSQYGGEATAMCIARQGGRGTATRLGEVADGVTWNMPTSSR